MSQGPPKSKQRKTLFPYTTLFRSITWRFTPLICKWKWYNSNAFAKGNTTTRVSASAIVSNFGIWIQNPSYVVHKTTVINYSYTVSFKGNCFGKNKCTCIILITGILCTLYEGFCNRIPKLLTNSNAKTREVVFPLANAFEQCQCEPRLNRDSRGCSQIDNLKHVKLCFSKQMLSNDTNH